MKNCPANASTVALVSAAVVITGNPVDVLTRIAIECRCGPST
jgi:malate/lactate dehydrogenase